MARRVVGEYIPQMQTSSTIPTPLYDPSHLTDTIRRIDAHFATNPHINYLVVDRKDGTWDPTRDLWDEVVRARALMGWTARRTGRIVNLVRP
jgi:hypothetical protein